MVSILKKSLGSLAGFGNPDLLPPADCISTQKYSENDDEDDCTGCSNPCSDHKEYPSYLNIEQDMPILGSVKSYGRHILIATGVSDWPRKIQHEKNTFAYSLSNAEKQHRTHSWKNLVTNSSLISTYTTVPDGCDVLIYPDNIIISNVTSEKAGDFYNVFLNAPLPADIESMSKDSRLGDMKIHKSPYKTTLLLCSHKKRDKRCGVTAPILAQEFDHVLREKDLTEQDAAVIMVSHIGGHKIAGNVICYINNGTRGIWYGRVKSCHCLPIVEQTVMQGKVIKDIYRGAMDNSFENQSKRSLLKW